MLIYAKYGDRYISIPKFGSRVDVFLPPNAQVKVSVGDKTKGGQTVLAELA